MFIILVWTIVHQDILKITKRYLNSWQKPTDGLGDTKITAEAEYSVNISKSRKKICLSLQCNASNSFLYANAVKIYQFKSKVPEIEPYLLCLRNIPIKPKVDKMKKPY